MITAETKGIGELIYTFTELTKNMQTRVATEAVTAAALRIERSMRRHARSSEDTGALVNSIGHNIKNKGKYSRKRRVFAAVGPEVDYRGPDGRRPYKYAHLVEFGHVAPNGRVVAAEPFARPAWAETGQAAFDEMQAVLKRRLPEEAAKAAKRNARKAGK